MLITYGNLKKVVNYYSGSGTYEGSDEYEYDNRQIPPFLGNNPVPTDRFSNNPILKYTSNAAPGSPTRALSYTCNNQYSPEGYIVQMTITYQGIGNPEIWTYTYACQ